VGFILVAPFGNSPCDEHTDNTPKPEFLRCVKFASFLSSFLFQVHDVVAIVTDSYAAHDPLLPRHPTESIVARFLQQKTTEDSGLPMYEHASGLLQKL
jgi:hypothetical protein